MSVPAPKRAALQRIVSTALLSLTALAAAAAPASAASPAGDVIHHTANGSSYVKTNPSTGASSTVGPFGFGSTFGAAIDTDGTIFASAGGTRLATVNPTTGHATPVGTASMPAYIMAIEIGPDGTAYGMGNRLYELNKTTGTGTPVGTVSSTASAGAMDMAFDCDGVLWATNGGQLWTVDTGTGVSTHKGAITGINQGAGSVMGLMFDSACQMLVTTYTSPGYLYSVNTTTRAATLIGSTGLSYPHGGDIGVGAPAPVDTDADGVQDSADNCPAVANAAQTDTDGDTVGNACDPDIDGDGTVNDADAFPLDEQESVDTDGDGTGNNADTDDDNDGVSDGNDAFPLDENESVDTDGDGTGNNADTDDDGDGVSDDQDTSPLDAANARPATKDACKANGYKAFLVDGVRFKNQGDCVSYVATGGRNLPRG